MASPQTPPEPDRRRLALWAADCAERVLPLFEAESSDDRPRDGIVRARAFGRGEADTASEIRRRFEAGRGASTATGKAAAARAAGQASGVAHMGAHALGAAAYAAVAAGLAAADEPGAREVSTHICHANSRLRTELTPVIVLAMWETSPPLACNARLDVIR